MLKKKKTTTVDLGDGDSVEIKKLSQGDFEESNRLYGKDTDKQVEGLRFIVARCVVENGQRKFTDADMPGLADEDFDTINTIAMAALKFSGVIKEQSGNV